MLINTEAQFATRCGLAWTATAAAAALMLAACGGGDSSGNTEAAEPTISVLSSKPSMVTEGSALIRVDAPAGASAANLKVSVGGKDVTTGLTVDGTSLVGLVKELPLGESTVTATAGGRAASLRIKNFHRDGPVISGPQQQPWICETDKFNLPDGSTLGAATDTNCNAETRVMYVYMARGEQAYKPLPSTSTLPADVATTVTSEGKTVNHIVRVESGTLNRGIYQLSILFDPTTDPIPSPAATYKGWNRKVVYGFGGSASAGYRQGLFGYGFNGTLIPDMLSKGYAVISSTLNTFGSNANDVLSAETASMVKEKFIKTFGVPIYTMGWGGSGGAMQQHLVANNYPGILDGIVPATGFPDVHSIMSGGADCGLLSRYFDAATQTWSDAQKTAVSGFNSWATCTDWNNSYSPTLLMAKVSSQPVTIYAGMSYELNNCLTMVPKSLLYDPRTNPTGARCDLYTNVVNTVGIDPSTGFAARAWDNVGVQYGLKALQLGAISPEQFVELNEGVGGYDNDGEYQAARSIGSPQALSNLTEFGRITDASNLGSVPIIDTRGYLPNNVHDSFRSMSLRARLEREQGNTDNHVLLRYVGVAGQAVSDFAFQKMDQWISSIKADTHAYASAAAKVVANKPADAQSACYTAGGEKIVEEPDINNANRCGDVVPFNGDPRLAAGAPLTDDVMKCQLKPLVRATYGNFTDAQFARLQAVFPSGVCDYSLPGAGAKRLKAGWLTYTSPGVAVPLSE